MENESQGRRIADLNELIELWPAVLSRMNKKIGAAAVAYLHAATPIAFDEAEIVLEYRDEFRLNCAIKASKRLPFEDVLNGCCVTPHRLRFQLAPQLEI